MHLNDNKFLSFLQIRENRNYGIELLRILAMYMVLVLHVLGMGGIIWNESTVGVNYWAAWFLEIAAFSAVDIYALISGFVGYKSKHRYADIAVLWLRVFVYTVSFTILNKLLFNPSGGKRKILLSFFPVTQADEWFFTMYFCLFFFMPVLNAAVESLSKKALRNVTVSLVILFSVIPFVWAADTFESLGGYSVIWLIVLYLIGAYIGKYNAFEKVKKTSALFVYFCSVVMTWCSKYVLQNHFHSFFGIEQNPDFLINYTSFTVLTAGISMLILFRDLKLPSFLKRVAAVIAPLTFGIYIIHTLPLIKNNYIADKFTRFNTYSVPVMILSVLGTAAVLFICCAAIDFIRARLFDLIKIRERLLKIENRLLSQRGELKVDSREG